MRKVFFVVVLLLVSLALFSCNNQKAFERMLANPEVAALVMQKIWENPELKAKMADMVANDATEMQAIMDRMVASPEMSKMMIDKLSANADCYKIMQEVTKKRK